jgi:hypothetical protein
MEPVWLLSVAGRDRSPVDPFGFLSAGRFRSEGPLLIVGFPWISLHTLVRI